MSERRTILADYGRRWDDARAARIARRRTLLFALGALAVIAWLSFDWGALTG